MTSSPRADAVSTAIQRALTVIEANANRQPLDLDLDLDELTRITSALIAIGSSLVQSFDRPHADVIEGLRMLALEATTGE